MTKIIPLLILAGMLQQSANIAPASVAREMKRLESCHPVFKLSPPPLNVRVVWTQPFDLVWSWEDEKHVSIEFSIQYAQSDTFPSQEEASHAEDFNPVFDLRQRSHYVMEKGQLRLLWRESKANAKWERQTTNQPQFVCWQTIPS